ncbi:MAG: plasmid pRiA4b ORF-3 family protein [Clostridiaceae bacterium]|nr:plasmid pRiA4b ORF-3 family protein [Clostridiaceae bacterium]
MTRKVEQDILDYMLGASVINVTTKISELVEIINKQNTYKVTEKDILMVYDLHGRDIGVVIVEDMIVNYMFLIDEKFTEEAIEYLAEVDLHKASKNEIIRHGKMDTGPSGNNFKLIEFFVKYYKEHGVEDNALGITEEHLRMFENILNFYYTGEVDQELLDCFRDYVDEISEYEEYDEYDEYIDEDDDFEFDLDYEFETNMTLMRNNSYVISVSLGTGCYRHIQINGNSTLEELHSAILDAFEFDDDHAHAFFMTNKEWDTQGAFYADFLDDERRHTSDYILNNFNFEKDDKFKYVFDFGANWVFQCKVLREENTVVDEPKVIKLVGEAPLQYGYDGDDEEEY